MKIINICIILFYIMITNVFSETLQLYDYKISDKKCLEIIELYQIDPKIKSVRGWKHVFKSEKWKKIFLLDVYTEQELQCLEDYLLKNAMDIKKYDKFIGVELTP